MALIMACTTGQLTSLAWIMSLGVGLASLCSVVALLYRLFTSYNLPSTLPWAGARGQHGRIARARANIASFFHLRQLLDEGYHEYSKRDRAYVLPYFLNGPEVVLPPSQIAWLVSQPDHILCQDKVNRQFLQAEYVFAHANLVKDPVHPEVIQQQLTRKLATFIPAIVQEMEHSLADKWGVNEGEWVEVGMYDTLLDIVTRLSLRVFMGPELCRDPALIKACQSFDRKVALPAAAISMFPELLKPIVAPFFTAYDYVQYLRCRRIILPIIRSRLEKLRNEELPVTDTKPPNDYIQWAIDHAFAKPVLDPLELDERVITSRFAVLCFAAIQSSVITLTNAIFDIVSSPERDDILSRLREDVLQATTTTSSSTSTSISSVVGDNAMVWTKASIAKMRLVDSSIRESMRLNGFIQRGVVKMVVAPEGVTLPDGSHLPCGTKVGVSGYSIHRDEDNYEDPNTFKPFRFTSLPPAGTTASPPQNLVNTSPTFMGFSHGAHACPGRFFAANQLKIALGHIALRYDITPAATAAAAVCEHGTVGDGAVTCTKRPENKWFFGHMAPPLTEKVRVRRRRNAASDFQAV